LDEKIGNANIENSKEAHLFSRIVCSVPKVAGSVEKHLK